MGQKGKMNAPGVWFTSSYAAFTKCDSKCPNFLMKFNQYSTTRTRPKSKRNQE